jgi:hypothetical protein
MCMQKASNSGTRTTTWTGNKHAKSTRDEFLRKRDGQTIQAARQPDGGSRWHWLVGRLLRSSHAFPKRDGAAAGPSPGEGRPWRSFVAQRCMLRSAALHTLRPPHAGAAPCSPPERISGRHRADQRQAGRLPRRPVALQRRSGWPFARSFGAGARGENCPQWSPRSVTSDGAPVCLDEPRPVAGSVHWRNRVVVVMA